MNRDDAYLLDIFNALQRIQAFAAGLTKEAFQQNNEKQSAILYQIIVIGEATKRLSPEIRQANSHIPWKDIAGMRDKLIHNYFNTDVEIIWEAVLEDVPRLKL